MSQEMSRAAQQKIAELLRKTKEKNKEHERNKWEHQEQMKKTQMEEQAEVMELPVKSVATSSSVTIKTKHGYTITVEHVTNITKGDESRTEQKLDDESRGMQVVWAEVHGNPEPSNIVSVDMEDSENESKSTHQETNEEDQPVVEFEDQAYELTQMYQLEQEYHEMTLEQEADTVQALTPLEQVEHQELMMLHQRQAEMEKEITGLSQIVKERAKAKAPGLPIDLIQRSVKTEAPERQQLHRLTEAQHTRVMTKQDEIPRTEKPGTHHRYYMFVEDDSGYLIEQRDEEGNV